MYNIVQDIRFLSPAEFAFQVHTSVCIEAWKRSDQGSRVRTAYKTLSPLKPQMLDNVEVPELVGGE